MAYRVRESFCLTDDEQVPGKLSSTLRAIEIMFLPGAARRGVDAARRRDSYLRRYAFFVVIDALYTKMMPPTSQRTHHAKVHLTAIK